MTLMALPDEKLVDAITTWGLGMMSREGFASLTQAERDIAESAYAFIVVPDDGLAWYLQTSEGVAEALRVSQSLRRVGLSANADIVEAMLAAFPHGDPDPRLPGPYHRFDQAWDQLDTDPVPALAAYARAHAAELRCDAIVANMQRPKRMPFLR